MFATVGAANPFFNSGYEQRAAEGVQSALGVVIPPDVVLAMRFIEHCNGLSRPQQTMLSFDGSVEPAEPYAAPELHPAVEAVLRRACVRVGRFFDGRGPRRAREMGKEQAK